MPHLPPLHFHPLHRFHEYYDDVLRAYHLQLRDQQAAPTGWPALDEVYRVVPGELTIVTGVPNSGKSEWLDALAANLAELHGWSFAFCSMEKKARKREGRRREWNGMSAERAARRPELARREGCQLA
jgi:twinkle protein